MSHHLAVFVRVAIVVGLSGAIVAGDDLPKFKIRTKRANDRVEVQAEKDTVVFSVHSPFGISQAVIERTSEVWPEALILRMYLQGLESFRVANGKLTLDATVSSQSDNERVRLWKDGNERQPLDSKSPLWMTIRLMDSDGRPTKIIPLKDGYFEMQLPKAIFEGNPQSFTVNWIDFSRN